MIAELNDRQIENILSSVLVGRIGCHSEGRTYVVPVAFAWHDGYIYAHSNEGLKVRMMRKNPSVCFQVDAIDSLANWRCVIMQGEFEELTTRELQLHAFNLLQERLSPFRTSDAAKPHSPPPGEKRRRPVFYRIRIVEKSGRYEKND